MIRNTAGQIVTGHLELIAGGPFVGTATVEVSKDGGAFAGGGGTIPAAVAGTTIYPPTQAETNAAHVAVKFIGTDAVSVVVNVYTRNDVDAAGQQLDTRMPNLNAPVASIPTTPMRGTDGANTTTPPTAAANADATWDEARSGHVGAGSFGEYLDAPVSNIPTTAMRGTDNALLATNAPTDFGLLDIGASGDVTPGGVNVGQIESGLTAAHGLKKGGESALAFTVVPGSTATTIATDAIGYPPALFTKVPRTLSFSTASGALRFLTLQIINYTTDGSTHGTFTVADYSDVDAAFAAVGDTGHVN